MHGLSYAHASPQVDDMPAAAESYRVIMAVSVISALRRRKRWPLLFQTMIGRRVNMHATHITARLSSIAISR